MTYHDRKDCVDFLHVVLILVENINRDTGLLAAKSANATGLESLHNGTGRINLSGENVANTAYTRACLLYPSYNCAKK